MISYNTADIVVSPPACYLEYTKSLVSSKIHTAGQNCYKVAKGAFTGDLSPQMLLDVGMSIHLAEIYSNYNYKLPIFT